MTRYFLAVVWAISALAVADGALERGDYGPLDRAPETALYDWPIEVAPGVFSAIGATQPGTYENAGHNNNLSFVIGREAVAVVNGGATNALARALHAEIRKRTELPVRYVFSENGQSHAVLGNHYWKSQGATLIGHTDAQHEIEVRGFQMLEGMRRYARERAEDTETVSFDVTFTDSYTVDLGGRVLEAKVFGPAHSPGDISVVIPDANVILAGDMAFHVRMPPIFDDTDTAGWLESFEVFADFAKDMRIVPGHGGPTDIATVTAGTKDYLVFLRDAVQEVIDAGGSLQDAYQIDQSAYAHWHTYEELAARNAGRVFERMEFE
ncbi:MAG: MBL fold metallo-hydrolase [Gammaproteobacteria bacterium]|nr:MBL fold metallo-hydrolase [Gammaproteobacteria bacterium]